MRVLITGAAGFIGSHLTERLLADGHKITGVDNFSTGKTTIPGVDYSDLDIDDRQFLYTVANTVTPELVIHCAASYSDPNLWHRDIDTNVSGTVNVVNVAKHHGARLVYFQTALPPISSYAISKIAGEQYIALSGVPHLIFRLANIYGPRNVSGPIPTFYKRIVAEQPCTVVDTRRDLVFIDDLVDCVLRGIKWSERGASRKFDVCSGYDHSIRDLFYTVAIELASDAQPTEIPAPADDVKSMELNKFDAFDVLGWAASTTLDIGVGKAVDWYVDHGVGDTYTHLNLKG